MVRKTVKSLRLHLLVNWWLRRFPVVKTLPGSGMRYRARRVESLALSVEMFDKGTLYSTSNMSGCAWFWHVPASLGSVLGDAWGVWTYKTRRGDRNLVAKLKPKQTLK